MTATIDVALEQLRASQSSKRRSAAKALRKLGDARATDALIVALQREVTDRRTWETQYQMVMALAACRARTAIRLLEQILEMDLEPMVHLAAGDALVRLSDEVDAAVTTALRSASLPRIEGAIRAAAMTHYVLAPATVDAVVAFASQPRNVQARFWVAAGAAGWRSSTIEGFLRSCLSDELDDTKRAARASLDGRYLKWNPL